MRRRLRAAKLDLALTLVGVTLGLPSLLYPFGRDQGLYFYVAREWLQRGQVPYRDVLDHKTPGIYILHAVAIAAFGEHQWGIRVLDLVGVVAFGLALGALYTRRGTPATDGVRGAGVALLALLFYGFLDFWNTAQSELWYSGLGIVAVWAVHRLKRIDYALFACGLACGAALVMKPPAAPLVLVAAAYGALRLRREGRVVRALPSFALGGALVPAFVLAYFAATHALGPMRDIVVGANAYYVKHEAGAPPGFDWKDFAGTILNYYAPFTVLFPIGAAVAWWRGRGGRDAAQVSRVTLASALMAATVAGVVVQGKFYLLHWAACCVALTFLGLVCLAELVRVPGGRVLAPLAVALAYVSTAWIPHSGVAAWQAHVLTMEVRSLRGTVDRDAFNATFQIPSMGFDYAASYRVGRWLADHTTTDDLVSVRGFQPEIYAVAGRHQVGRFFWTLFLTNPSRAYRRAEWLAEDARDLREHPPKYVVATTKLHEGPESAEWLAAFGYVPVHVDGVFTIVERTTADR